MSKYKLLFLNNLEHKNSDSFGYSYYEYIGWYKNIYNQTKESKEIIFW